MPQCHIQNKFKLKLQDKITFLLVKARKFTHVNILLEQV